MVAFVTALDGRLLRTRRAARLGGASDQRLSNPQKAQQEEGVKWVVMEPSWDR